MSATNKQLEQGQAGLLVFGQWLGMQLRWNIRKKKFIAVIILAFVFATSRLKYRPLT